MKERIINLLKKYLKGTMKSYKDGPFKISEGGYDLYFEIYYNNSPIIGCIDGNIEAYDKQGLQYLEAVQSTYKKWKMY